MHSNHSVYNVNVNNYCRYKTIEEALSQSSVYSEPLFLNDFAPIHPRLRYDYIH